MFRSEFFFRTIQELEYLFFFVARIFFPEFNIRLYDKNSESDYFFYLHQNQNIFFSNIGNQNIFLEKKHNPLQVKWSFPNSWFICVNKILRKYDLKEAYNYLDNPIKKSRWISVKSTVNDHWCTQLTTLAQLYKGLQYLSNHNLSKCKIHPILKHRCYSSLDISRIPVKLRLVTRAANKTH